MQIHKEEAHGIAKGGKVESTKVAAQPSVNVTDDDVGDAADTELLLQSVHP